MKVNTDIWGDSSTWLKDAFFWSSTDSSFTDDDLAWYNANPRTITGNTHFTINNPIDYSICYAAHAATEKMPLADIEVYDYQAAKVLEQKETAGFFFCDYPNTAAPYEDIWSWQAIKNNTTADLQKTGIYRWLQNAYPDLNGTLNCNGQTRPVVQFGIKSLFGDIRVALIKNDYSDYNYLWLKELEDDIDIWKDNWHIEECFLRLWTYNGRTGDDFNPFTRNQRTKFNNIGSGGIVIDKNLKIVGSDKELNNYDMFISNGFLPIFGTGLNNIENYRNLGRYGIPISKRASLYYEYYDRSYSICMASAADLGVSVYETENEYGHPAYLLNPKMSITAENCEKLRKGAAAYGLFFTDSNPSTNLLTDSTNENRWLHNDMLCGVLDRRGIGHGEYTRGARNATNSVYKWVNSQDSSYGSIEYGTYCKVCGYGGEVKPVCPRCHATGNSLVNIPAMTQGPIWKLDVDDPEYGSLYELDMQRDQESGYTNPNLHRRAELHVDGTYEELWYPNSREVPLRDFQAEIIDDVRTITKYNGTENYVKMPDTFVEAGYTTLGKGLFTDTDVVYVEIPEGITTIE